MAKNITFCHNSNEWIMYMPGLARVHHAAVGDRGGGHPAVQVQHVFTSTGVNLTNILRAAFSYESVLRCFSLLSVWCCNFF
jgi:hypothetical protein